MRKKHREGIATEFLWYKNAQEMVKLPWNIDIRHYCFGFAETVLRPRLLRHPGQIHFVVGINFDFNGVFSSKSGFNQIFGLAEGYLSGDKSANDVLSMLHHVLNLPEESVGSGDNINLTADNCSGQNMNRYVLWYLFWLVSTGRKSRVKMCFPIIGHTKKSGDGAFGCAKRCLRELDDNFTEETMRFIEESSAKNNCIPGEVVSCRTWNFACQVPVRSRNTTSLNLMRSILAL